VSLGTAQGRSTLLLGPPGCGKTVFMRVLSQRLKGCDALNVAGQVGVRGVQELHTRGLPISHWPAQFIMNPQPSAAEANILSWRAAALIRCNKCHVPEPLAVIGAV
jgi:energy-coupling factor transporter ATP-binding protein EcfA2